MTDWGPPAAGFARTGERVVHRGYIWTVVVAEFVAPDGSTFERDIVRSPGAVGVLPLLFDADGVANVVLVSQFRSPFERELLEIPAGMRDVPGEPPELTARRELIEEAGFEAGELEWLHTFAPSAGMTDSTCFIFLATGLTAVPRDVHGPEEEHMTVIHLPLATAVDMVIRGEIIDAKTALALLMTERLLSQRRFGSLPAPAGA
jgi:8-oxo-dGDP phosphatase